MRKFRKQREFQFKVSRTCRDFNVQNAYAKHFILSPSFLSVPVVVFLALDKIIQKKRISKSDVAHIERIGNPFDQTVFAPQVKNNSAEKLAINGENTLRDY